MALRYFYEEMPELHVIAAGSLLEFAFYTNFDSRAEVDYLADKWTSCSRTNP